MKIRIERWDGSCICPWKSIFIVGTDWAFLPISGIRLDDFRQEIYCPQIVVVQEALMVTETSLSMVLLIYGLFLDKPNKIPYIGLFSALFVLIFRVASVGFVSSTETLGLDELYKSSMWAHLAENIALIVHILMWALLCEFNITIDTQAWRRFRGKFCSKTKTNAEEQQKKAPSSEAASITSSLPSYRSEVLPSYTNNAIQMNLPPLYEEEYSDDDSQNRRNLAYPTPAYFGQHRVVWNTFITISTEGSDLTEDVAESVVFDTSNETSRSRNSKSRCIIQ